MEGDDIWGETKSEDPVTAEQPEAEEAKEPELEDDETRHMSVGELRQRIHLINNDIRIMKSDVQRITHESRGQRERIRDNQEKVKLNKQLPYLVANVVEILEPDAEDGAYCVLPKVLSFLELRIEIAHWEGNLLFINRPRRRRKGEWRRH